ncbi:MAG: FtsW/RodA/SpoVE family cell cycle protein [Marinilabiliales bacterium]|nr:FtsW/RodA/SpoVE family cell cycle protein [Marinilabiliales bacterium]
MVNGWYLFCTVLIGWFNIYAAVYNEEHQSIFDFSQRYGKQLVWILAAIALMIIVFSIDINFYSFFAYFLYAFMILLLIAVLVLGREVHGAKIMVRVGWI